MDAPVSILHMLNKFRICAAKHHQYDPENSKYDLNTSNRTLCSPTSIRNLFVSM